MKGMIAIDTNVLVRLLIVDDSRQTAAARTLARTHRLRILRTVLLETEWLLRARFGLKRKHIQAFFDGLAQTRGIEMEDQSVVRQALVGYSAGLDFADAMHAAAAGDTPLYTFDTRFAHRAARFGCGVKLADSD